MTETTKKVFKGFVGSYGKIKGASAFVAFIGDTEQHTVQEQVGYMNEGVILETTALGLNTCWIGGFFRSANVAPLVGLKPNERVLAVSPVGYAYSTRSFEESVMAGFGRHDRRHSISKLLKNPATEDKMPDWVRKSIQAARLAPSALNRQPWGFDVKENTITVYVRTGGPDFGISKRLDCGICMLHLEIAAMNCGITGSWQFLEPPLVAKFTAKTE